jgi:hypothetical protein
LVRPAGCAVAGAGLFATALSATLLSPVEAVEIHFLFDRFSFFK